MKQSKIRGLFATSHRHADVQPFPVKQHPEQLLGVTNAITPSIPPSSSSPRAFLAEHSAIWCRSCLWSAGLAGAQLLVHPQLHGCGGQRGKRRKKPESLNALQALFSDSQKTGVLSALEWLTCKSFFTLWMFATG